MSEKKNKFSAWNICCYVGSFIIVLLTLSIALKFTLLVIEQAIISDCSPRPGDEIVKYVGEEGRLFLGKCSDVNCTIPTELSPPVPLVPITLGELSQLFVLGLQYPGSVGAYVILIELAVMGVLVGIEYLFRMVIYLTKLVGSLCGIKISKLKQKPKEKSADNLQLSISNSKPCRCGKQEEARVVEISVCQFERV